MSYLGNPLTTAAFVTDQLSGTGSQTAFTLSAAPASSNSIIVAVSGIIQEPSTYSVVGTTLNFSAAPPAGTANISVRHLGIPASGVANTAYRTVTEFTATAGQTTFTIPSYTVGYLDVYRNGAKLGSADFTATTGAGFVLTDAAAAGDLITAVSFYVSSVLNALPLTGGTVTGVTNFNTDITVNGGTANGVAYLNGSKVLTTGSALTFDGTTLNFGGTAQRITGDFSNATASNRVLFQSSTTNGQTSVNLIPNGTSRFTSLECSNGTDASNCSLGYIGISGSSDVRFVSTRRGSGAYLPMVFYTGTTLNYQIDTSGNSIWSPGGSEQMRLNSTGLGIGTSSIGAKLTIYSSSSTANLTQWYGGTADPNFVTYAKSGVATAYAGAPQFSLGMDYATTYTDLCAIKFARESGAGGIMQFFTGVNANGSERMRIDSSGNVGIGTSSPITKTDIAVSAGGASQTATALTLTNTFDAADNGVRLAWRQSGAAYETAYITSMRQGASAVSSLVFATSSSPWATGAPTERMRIDSSGNLLVGTTSQVFGSNFITNISGVQPLAIKNTGSSVQNSVALWQTATTGDNRFIEFGTEGSYTARGAITYNRGAGQVAYNTTSDYRLKENIVDLPNALKTVEKLKPRQFDWKETGNTTTGFIAHELAEVLPHAVSGEKDAVDEEGNPVYQGIDTSFLVATLTKAIQEQQQLIESLTARVAQLEGK